MRIPAFWVQIAREIFKNKARSVLVILSIATGISAVGMTLLAGSIIDRDLNQSFKTTNPASVTLYLSPFQKDLIPFIENKAVIAQAEAKRIQMGEVLNQGKWVKIEMDSVPDFSNIRINRFRTIAGKTNPGRKEVLLERLTAEMLGVSIGDVITIRINEESRSSLLTVVGIVHDLHKMPPMWMETGAGYISMDTLRWMGVEENYNALDLILADRPYDPEHILTTARWLRDHVIEESGLTMISIKPFINEPGQHWAGAYVNGILMVLLVIGLVCLLISAGIVINTISALIAGQIRQIGVIRAIGGTRWQVARMYVVMASFFGFCALFIAIPLGMAGALGLARGVGSVINFDVVGIEFSTSTVLVQIGLGIFVPLLAAAFPIRNATRISVYQAVYLHGENPTVKAGAINGISKKLSGLATPVILGIRNAFRRRVRLVLTIITLTLAGATFMGAFHTQKTLSEKIGSINRYWLFDTAIELSTPVRCEKVENELSPIPEIKVAEEWYHSSVSLVLPGGKESEEIETMAVPTNARTVDPLLVMGRWFENEDETAFVVNEDLVSKVPGIEVGQDILFRIVGDGERSVYKAKVVGIVSRHIIGERIYTPLGFWGQINHSYKETNLVRIRSGIPELLSGDQQGLLTEKIKTIFKSAGIETSGSETQYQAVASNAGNFDILLIVLLLMAGLLAIVGGLGLAGTLGISVMERTREIGVLRAVGARAASIRWLVVLEGLAISFISAITSVLFSFVIGWGFSSAIGAAVLQTTPEFFVSTTGIWLWFGIVLVIALIASLAPAARASRLTIRETLAYE